MGTVSNILVGPASLSVDSSDVGYTSGGVKFGPLKDIWMRPSLKGVGSKEAVLLDQKFIIATHLAEATFKNLKLAWGMDVSDASTTTENKCYFGGGSDISYHTVEMVGKAPGSGKSRTVHFYRVCSVEFGQMEFSRSRETLIPVTFEALLDENKNPTAQTGWIKDEV